MFIQTEPTPNPAQMKFLPGQTVLPSGTAHFADAGTSERSPLARRLFAVEGVTGVFLDQDSIVVSKSDDTDWQILKTFALAAIMNHFTAGEVVMLEDEEPALTEEDLTDPQRFPGTNGQPLWRGLAGNGLVHTALHFGEFYANWGDLERANALQHTAVDLLLGLDDSENWRSVVLYNLACHYAITRQPDAVIPKLREAFALNAGLVDYSRQDPDLKSLRELADYQALAEA